MADDDEDVRAAILRGLAALGVDAKGFEHGKAALDHVVELDGDVDVILSDLHMPTMGGLEFLSEVRGRWPDISFVVMTGDATVSPAIEAMRRGAYDYVIKPLAFDDDLELTLQRAVERTRLLRRTRVLEKRLDIAARFEGIVGSTPSMREVFQLVESVAGSDVTVLVLGESGTGKELVARAVHARSKRSEGPFLAVNCSALTETLLESELFGHVKGAFTGATSARRGLFEQAHGGTLFLDEIGDVSPAVQVRLLRALQEGEVKPVGAAEVRKVDVRVIAATNRDLAADAKKGTFREDLYYRLNVVALEIPPLRERADDIPLLISHLLARHSERFGKAIPRVDEQAMRAMLAHPWPGNVRELDNAVQRAVVLAHAGVIDAGMLPKSLRPAAQIAQPTDEARSEEPFVAARARVIAAFEKRYVEGLLSEEGGNISRCARRAGLDKSNFKRVVRRYAIDVDRFRSGSEGAAQPPPGVLGDSQKIPTN